MEFDWLTKYRKKTEYQKVMLLYLLLNDYKANIHHADTEIETESYGKTYTKVYGYTTDMIDVEAIQTDIRQTPKPIVCSKKDYQSIAKSQNVFLYQPRFEKDLVINDIDIIGGVMLIDKNIVISDMLAKTATPENEGFMHFYHYIIDSEFRIGKKWYVKYDNEKSEFSISNFTENAYGILQQEVIYETVGVSKRDTFQLVLYLIRRTVRLEGNPSQKIILLFH